MMVMILGQARADKDDPGEVCGCSDVRRLLDSVIPFRTGDEMISHYICLFFAILCEVIGTMLLPASQNFTKPFPTVMLAICYLAAFYLLTFAIRSIPVPIVYATWSGLGIFTIAIVSTLIFKQPISWPVVLGLFLIVTGVVLVNLFSPAHS